MVFTSLLGLAFVWLPVWGIHSLALPRGLMRGSVADVRWIWLIRFIDLVAWFDRPWILWCSWEWLGY